MFSEKKRCLCVMMGTDCEVLRRESATVHLEQILGGGQDSPHSVNVRTVFFFLDILDC